MILTTHVNMILFNLEHLSSFNNYILMVIVLRYISFDVNHITIFKVMS